MLPELHLETERLQRSWSKYTPGILRDYLVEDVEDPRINFQSILTRHYIIREALPGRFEPLMDAECRFSAVVGSLRRVLTQTHHPEDIEAVLHALDKGSDNAEGIEIPHPVVRAYQQLPVEIDGLRIPNYVRNLLEHVHFADGNASFGSGDLDSFGQLWPIALGQVGADSTAASAHKLAVLEPACGSANDARFFKPYAIASLLQYTGFDLCPANIENAKLLYPEGNFQVGNVFAIDAPDQVFDVCVVHDLFEHLSLSGLSVAVAEVCRVTQRGICAHFFNMDEMPAHKVQEVEDYHWNKLGLAAVLNEFEKHGFSGTPMHLGTVLRAMFDSETHNPNAYTIYFKRESNRAGALV